MSWHEVGSIYLAANIYILEYFAKQTEGWAWGLVGLPMYVMCHQSVFNELSAVGSSFKVLWCRHRKTALFLLVQLVCYGV